MKGVSVFLLSRADVLQAGYRALPVEVAVRSGLYRAAAQTAVGADLDDVAGQGRPRGVRYPVHDHRHASHVEPVDGFFLIRMTLTNNFLSLIRPRNTEKLGY